jgi:hypothetical protein
VLVHISQLYDEPELPFEPFGTTPKGLTTSGLSISGRINIAPTASISLIAEVTKLSCARPEGAFIDIFGDGAPSFYFISYMFSIEERTRELLTNVR